MGFFHKKDFSALYENRPQILKNLVFFLDQFES